MKKITRLLALIFLALSANLPLAALASVEDSPIGFWKTTDDATGRPGGIIEIYRESDQTLSGRVLKIFSEAETGKRYCDNCSGEDKGRAVVGMRVMNGLSEESDNSWEGGTILDPKSGRKYRCNLQLSHGGQELDLRGFIGVAWLGRTQVWNRLDPNSADMRSL